MARWRADDTVPPPPPQCTLLSSHPSFIMLKQKVLLMETVSKWGTVNENQVLRKFTPLLYLIYIYTSSNKTSNDMFVRRLVVGAPPVVVRGRLVLFEALERNAQKNDS